MVGSAPQIEWYIARDGQQYGPLSDPELRKFVELGHLRPTDLVWRQGFPDWRPAPSVFPTTAHAGQEPAAARPAPQQPARPAPQPEPSHQAPQAGRYAAQPESARQMAQPTRHAPHSEPSHQAQSARYAPQPEPSRQAPQPARHVAQADPRHAPQFVRQAAAAQAATAARQTRPAEPARMAPSQVAVPADSPYDETADFDDEDHETEAPSPGRVRRLARAMALVLLLGGASWVAVDYVPSLTRFISLSGGTSAGSNSDEPLQLAGGSSEELDASFQRTALWRLIRADFPDWYQARLDEAVRLKSEGQDDAAVARHLAQALVGLRRENANQALAASPEALRAVAGSFLDSLKHLSAYSSQACFGFISQGETSPQVLELMGAPEHAEPLQRQTTATFVAVSEGRRSPQTHLPPKQTDYQALTSALTTGLGWTDRDLQLFSNPRALAQAAPEQVCKMVQDWFTAQLSITDKDVQLRLLIESLKPVVAG